MVNPTIIDGQLKLGKTQVEERQEETLVVVHDVQQ